MKIEIGTELNSSNLHLILNQYWEKSFANDSNTFDFSKLEWIANPEVAFIIAWIKILVENGKTVSIELQSNRDISTKSNEYKRRKYCLKRLMQDWKIRRFLPNEVKLHDGGVVYDSTNWDTLSDIIPMPIINYTRSSFDNEFDGLFNNECKNLKNNYHKLLTKTELNYIDAEFLNYSVVKELYSNVCLHSNSKISSKCYLSIGLNHKYPSNEYEEYISEQRIKELSPLDRDYFTSKNSYRNLDYVEFTFQDFGIGIENSLKEKYLSETEASLKQFFDDEYQLHTMQNLDSKILHYSLLLFTSKFEIAREFEIHDYIPRGLFILQEIIEKYQGYLEIFSGTGGIGISFKDGVKRVNFVNKGNKRIMFPGTRIKLVFPSKENISSIAKILRKSTTFSAVSNNINYFHFLERYSSNESRLKKNGIDQSPSALDTMFLSIFFQSILKDFQNVKKGQIILFDFAGIDTDTIDLFNKFVYFIAHCPINSTHRIILYNINVRDLNSTIIFNSINTLKSKGFTPYPVPAITSDLEVEWLGIDEHHIGSIFTQIWKGDLSKEYQYVNFSNYSSISIGVIQLKSQYKLIINLPVFEEIVLKIKENISKKIQDEIKGKGIQFVSLTNREKNYNNVLIRKEGMCFLNSNGLFQSEYLSFMEKLYIRAYRKMLSTYFIFSIICENDFDISKVTKILSVTLSSQFLGNEVKDLFEKLFRKSIELIALSNYYNFQNEERFKDIHSKDSILVVNDIISTGNLTENIFQSIERKMATPLGCICIIDLREESNSDIEYPIVSLTKYKIEKTEDIPINTQTEWINPILNAPVTIRKTKSKVITLFSQDEFLDQIQPEYILIGNIKNNSNYMNYYLDTAGLLQNDYNNGFKFIKILIERFMSYKNSRLSSELDMLTKGLDIIAKNIEDDANKKAVLRINKQLKKIELNPLINEYKIDIIFYPFLSKISIIEENLYPFSDLRIDKKLPLIYPIPRIMTTKGWRFTFPPKFLNILTESSNLNVLIIDDGSCTGATIMQMIDATAFLSVKSIDVLSIFGRLEDYQNELFSRIKSVKVKNEVVPLNILYGVHFNLPVYNSSDNPLLIELREIEQLEKLFSNSHIQSEDNFEEFLIELKKSLSKSLSPQEFVYKDLIYSFVSKKKMIQLRDLVSKFDSFRLFSEDIPTNGDFNKYIDSNESLISLLAVLNLEIHLYQVIKRMFSKDVISLIRNKTLSFIENNSFITNEEQQIFILKSLFYIDARQFIKSENLIRLCETIFKMNFTSNSYRYISYLLFVCGLNIRPLNDIVAQKSFNSNMLAFMIELKESNEALYDKFRFFFESFRKLRDQITVDDAMPANKYYRLCEYFSKVLNNENSHSEKLLPNHFNDIGKNIEEFIYSLQNEKSEDIRLEKVKFEESFKTIRKKYFEDFIEYRFIKEIVYDLKSHSNIDMEFNPSLLYDTILKLEKSLNFNYNQVKDLQNFSNNIKNYINFLLLSDSDFLHFITNMKSNILDIWMQSESVFKSEPEYKAITKLSEINFDIKVNQYILKLTFDNLISSKIKYAKSVPWEISAKEKEDVIELYIKQYSAFIKDVGDGTGQQSIKSILYNFGTLYKKVCDNPYTIRITFTK